jgi:hypothetical protein
MKLITNVVSGVFVVVAIAGCAVRSSPSESTEPSGSSLITPIGGDAGCPGVGSVICINGGHWDPTLCECVPPSDAGCVDNVLCIVGDHWDPTLCKCVPDADAGVCISSEDGPCGGFTTHPCTCAPGLTCVPNRIPDIPGTCQPARCCPASWDMYSCKEENGSAGLNCHNPLLGCASSLTCGGGCDFEVTGRCPVCDPLVCPAGETWNPVVCKCEPPACATAADCTGPLPDLCMQCPSGGTGCAHWTCVAGTCEVAYCP